MKLTTSRRRRVAGISSLIGGAALALGSLTSPVGAQQPDNPGGNEDCPAGTTEVAKFERVGDTDDYTAEHGGDVVTLSNTSTTSVDWDSGETPISHIVVKGGPGATIEVVDPAATSGTVTNANVPEVGQGNIPAISNLKFCTPDETTDDGGDDGGDVDGGDVDGGDVDGGDVDGGDGTPATVLPGVIEQPTPQQPAPPAAPQAAAQTLPVTGVETSLALIGFGLLLAGAGFLLYGSPTPAHRRS